MIRDFKLIPIDIINNNSLIFESSYLQYILNYIFTFLICEKYQEIYAQLKFLKYNS